MGSQFSSGFVPQDLQHYQDFSLARVTQLHNKFKQLCDTEFENNGHRKTASKIWLFDDFPA